MSDDPAERRTSKYLAVATAALLVASAVAFRPYRFNNAIALLLAVILLSWGWRAVWRDGLRVGLVQLPWRKLLAAVILSTVAFWMGSIWYQQANRQIIARHVFIARMDNRFAVRGPAWQYKPIAPPRWNNWLRLMWLLGEERAPSLNVALGDSRDDRQSTNNARLIQSAKQLFPEATISIGWRGSLAPDLESLRLD